MEWWFTPDSGGAQRTSDRSGVAFDGKTPATARHAWVAVNYSFRRHPRIGLALRRQHLQLARRLRLKRRTSRRARTPPLKIVFDRITEFSGFTCKSCLIL